MFFLKKSQNKIFEGLKIAVVGAAPTALFLSALFKEKGAKVVNFINGCKLKELKKVKAFSFKNVSFQNRFVEFDFGTDETSFDFCFLCSAPDDIKSDILMLSGGVFEKCKIVNLTPELNKVFLQKVKKIKTTECLFDCLVNRDGANIEVLTRTPSVVILENSDKTKDIEDLFNNCGIVCQYSKNSKNDFEQAKASFIFGNLCLLIYGDKLFEELCSDVQRKEIEEAIKEYCESDKKESLNRSSVLSGIYTFSDRYRSGFDSKDGFVVMAELLKKADYFNTPNLYKLLAKAAKKY